MKKARHSKILDIISSFDIETQEDLIEELKASGVSTTQATVSRDIKELRLIKISTHDGKYKYSAPDTDSDKTKSKYSSILLESIVSMDYAGNTVVIKCNTGMANAACAYIDTMNWPDMVGSLAGDDTIFILMRSEENCDDLIQKIEKICNR